MPFVEQDVLGLHVAVNDPLAMGVVQRIGRLAGEPERPAERDAPLGDEQVAQGAAFDVRGDVIKEAVRLARVVQRQQVGMMEPRGHLDLAQKALGAEHLGEPLLQHLERDRAVVPEVAREVDDGHTAVAHLALDRIAAGQGGLESVQQVEHAAVREVGFVSIPPCPTSSQGGFLVGPLHRQARMAAANTAGTLAQLPRSSSAVIRAMRACALRWLSE